MSQMKLFVLVTLTSIVFLFSGLWQTGTDPLVFIPNSSSPPPSVQILQLKPVPMPETWKHVNARDILQNAMERFATQEGQWLQTTIHQESVIHDIIYEADGRYLAAPQGRFHLELLVSLGKLEGKLDIRCDGQQIQEQIALGKNGRYETKVLAPLNQPPGFQGKATPTEGERIKSSSILHIPTLLKKCLEGLQEGEVKAVIAQGRTYLQIRGKWQKRKTDEGKQGYEGRNRPEEVCLFLDPETLWPSRVEWWGKYSKSGPGVLLVQTEYREPIINQPLNLLEMKAEFEIQSP